MLSLHWPFTQAMFRAPRRTLLEALNIVRDGLDLIIGQTGHRFLMRHLSGIVALAEQQHNVVLAQFGGLQGRPIFPSAVAP